MHVTSLLNKLLPHKVFLVGQRILVHTFWGYPLFSVFVNALFGCLLSAIHLSRAQLDSISPAECPWCVFFYTGSSSASGIRILKTVSGITVSISTLTFSLTVVAVQLASQSYTPRLLDEFIKDPMTKRSFAINLGAWAFCFAVTMNMYSDADFPEPSYVPVIAVNFVIMHAIMVVVMFITFIHSFVNGMRLENILHRASRSAWRAVNEIIVRNSDTAIQAELPKVPPYAYRILADDSGYLSSYELQKLLSLAVKLNFIVRFSPHIGQFVTEGTVIAWVWSGEITKEERAELSKSAEEKKRRSITKYGLDLRVKDNWNELPSFGTGDEFESAQAALGKYINKAMIVNIQRSREVDVSLGIQQLSDIAVRALSRGKNDPYSAVQALDSISVVFSRLAGETLPVQIAEDDEGIIRVSAPARSYGYLLSITMDPIRAYGFHSVAIVRRAVRLLGELGALCRRLDREDRVEFILAQIEQWMNSAREFYKEDSPEMRSIEQIEEYQMHMIATAKSVSVPLHEDPHHKEDDLENLEANNNRSESSSEDEGADPYEMRRRKKATDKSKSAAKDVGHKRAQTVEYM